MFHVIHELLLINILYIDHLRRLVKYVNHLAIFVLGCRHSRRF